MGSYPLDNPDPSIYDVPTSDEMAACPDCEGRGFEWRVPHSFNPFYAGGFATARAMYKVPCRNGCPFPNGSTKACQQVTSGMRDWRAHEEAVNEAADAIAALTRELEGAKEARDRLAYVLGHARDAIASLGVEDLGVGNLGGLGDPYPIRDELLARIDAALLSTAPSDKDSEG